MFLSTVLFYIFFLLYDILYFRLLQEVLTKYINCFSIFKGSVSKTNKSAFCKNNSEIKLYADNFYIFYYFA